LDGGLRWITGVVDEVVLVQVWMSRRRCEHSKAGVQEMRLRKEVGWLLTVLSMKVEKFEEIVNPNRQSLRSSRVGPGSLYGHAKDQETNIVLSIFIFISPYISRLDAFKHNNSKRCKARCGDAKAVHCQRTTAVNHPIQCPESSNQ
jgi:hypothetical protein